METTRRSVFLFAVICAVLIPGTAAAHGDMEETFPKDGATLKKPADHVMITFSEAPTKNTSVRVIDGCGVDVVDETYITDKTLHVLLTEGQPGSWLAAYRVISAEDGHKTAGNFSFTVKGVADCSEEEPEPGETIAPDPPSEEQAAPDTSDTSDEGSSIPIVALLVGGAALVGIAALVRLRSGL